MRDIVTARGRADAERKRPMMTLGQAIAALTKAAREVGYEPLAVGPVVYDQYRIAYLQRRAELDVRR